MKYSPWGEVQYEHKYCRGLTFISTASHGGMLVSKGFAKKNLSLAAQKKGMVWNNYLCYEKDCLINIIILELSITNTLNRTEEDIIKSISYYDADYLLERGIEPNQEAYSVYLKQQENDRKRKEKDPDLIISASEVRPGICKVYTADDKEHFITTESYRACNSYSLKECIEVNFHNI